MTSISFKYHFNCLCILYLFIYSNQNKSNKEYLVSNFRGLTIVTSTTIFMMKPAFGMTVVLAAVFFI